MKGAIAMADKKTEPINLADVKEQVKAIIAEAKAEAAKIVADAKASVSGELTEEQIKANEERKAYWDELVEVRLFKDNNKYKDDVFVSVNGENCVIKRGERVKVKRKFAEVLDKSDLQDYETSKLIEKKSKEFANAEK
jgi:hypothetical protein